MIEHYFVQPTVLRRLRTGPLAPYLDDLAGELQRLHYSRKSIRRQLRNVAAFGRWLRNQNIALSEVTEAVLERYVAPMHRSSCPFRRAGYRPHNGRGLPRVLDLLRRLKLAPAAADPAPPAPGSTEHWVTLFDQHLDRVAGLTLNTRRRYRHTARSFMTSVFPDGQPDWTRLRAEHIGSFVEKTAARRAPTCRKDPAKALLIFLRFLIGAGRVESALVYGVPAVRQWKHAALPRFITVDDLNRVLEGPAESTPKALRDRAMLLKLPATSGCRARFSRSRWKR